MGDFWLVGWDGDASFGFDDDDDVMGGELGDEEVRKEGGGESWCFVGLRIWGMEMGI